MTPLLDSTASLPPPSPRHGQVGMGLTGALRSSLSPRPLPSSRLRRGLRKARDFSGHFYMIRRPHSLVAVAMRVLQEFKLTLGSGLSSLRGKNPPADSQGPREAKAGRALPCGAPARAPGGLPHLGRCGELGPGLWHPRLPAQSPHYVRGSACAPASCRVAARPASSRGPALRGTAAGPDAGLPPPHQQTGRISSDQHQP